MNTEFKSLVEEELGISLTSKQLNQFEIYYNSLVSYNKKINLTAITDYDEVFKIHFLDSLLLRKAYKFNNQSIFDVGSGAGFPSIPLKILFPSLNITIIDALQKRINFLNDLTKQLSITVNLIHGRAEDQKFREEFDIVTARAVANLRLLSELCLPFVKINGYFLAMKGPNYKEELKQSSNAINLLGGKPKAIVEYQIDDMSRTIIKIQKVKKTPNKYPRKFSKIKSNPL